MGLFSRRGSAELITDLRPGEIFVFGSNAAGSHAGGAARQAVRDFGAIMGQARGLQGRSYALVSMSGLDVIAEETATFCAFARTHPELRLSPRVPQPHQLHRQVPARDRRLQTATTPWNRMSLF